MTLERIYIGGLDPKRLTVKDVLDRLESTLGDQIEIRDVDQGSCFCHVNAQQKESLQTIAVKGDGPESTSKVPTAPALHAIVKLYNNVTWKGCKIKVEAARPHILERLEQERTERQETIDAVARHAQQQKEKLLTARPEPSILPRHLKIYKAFGQESLAVDTKPVRVTEWPVFTKMRRKLQKHREKSVAASLKAHCNRGVHLRFVDKAESANTTTIGGSNIPVDGNDEHPRKNEDQHGDDDDDDESASSMVSSDNDTQDSDSTSVSSTTDNGDVPPHPPQEHPVAKSAAYVWSDEEGSDSEATADFIQTNRPVADHSLDEFAAALDHADNDSKDDDDISRSDPFAAHSAPAASGSADLANDVESNLNLLSKLFPDLADRQPRAIQADGDDDTNNGDTAALKPATEPSSWSNSGQMLRYDPTKESAKQFVIAPEQKEEEQEEIEPAAAEDDSDESLSQEESTADSEQSSAESEQEDEGSVKKEDVYEQGKLEEVFREAREVQEAPTVVLTEQQQPESSNFSFSFKVDSGGGFDKNAEAKAESTGAFSFKFDAGAAESQETVETLAVESSGEQESEALQSMTEEEHRPAKRYRGLHFPEEDLIKYVNVFYSLYDGQRAMENLEGFRRDEWTKEHWSRERLALTQDWKRKRKYAESRKQKRFGK
jgi:hypothetical protein